MFIVAIAILSAIVMWLWNLLIPDLFHGPELNYWQAMGLLVLTRVLVGIRGRHGHWWRGRHWKKHWKRQWKCCPPWQSECYPDSPDTHRASQEEWQAVKNKWKAEFAGRMHDWWHEWEAMSPEERRRYKQEHRQAGKAWKDAYRARYWGYSSEREKGREDDASKVESGTSQPDV